MKGILYGALLSMAISIAGCGGGGGSTGGSSSRSYEGSTSSATVTDDNAQDIINTSREGAKAAIAQMGADDIAPRTAQQPSITDTVETISKQLAGFSDTQTRSVAPRVTETVRGDCGGSATVYVSDSNSETSGSIRITYNDYCTRYAAPDGSDFIIDGVVTLDYSETRFVLQYRNVDVTYGGNTQWFNLTVACTGEFLDECTYRSDFEGSDGRIYRITDVNVTNNGYSYGVEARVYNPDHGYFDIFGTNLTVCNNGNIGSGTVIVSDSTGLVMRLDYVSCSQVTVTRGDNSEIINQ